MRKLGILVLVMLLLVGCSQTSEGIQEESTGDVASMSSLDDSYYKIVNLGGSDLRERFYTDFYKTKDFETIGRDLQVLSSQYFSTSDYYMSEGMYIGREEKKELMNWDSEYSIQPKKGTVIEGVTSPIMFSNLHEQDYYIKEGNKYILKGISLAIVIDPRDSKNKALETPMSDATIKKYARDCISGVYEYFQKSESMNEVKNIPILIAVYQATDETKSTINGSYIYSSYCEKQVGDIKSLNYKNVIFSSDEAEKLDKVTYSEFSEIKNNLKKSAIEAAGLVGEAKYINDEIQSMIIEANLNVKTYSELQYLTSLIADNIDEKFTADFDIKVLVKSQDDLEAIILKEAGQKTKTHFLY